MGAGGGGGDWGGGGGREGGALHGRSSYLSDYWSFYSSSTIILFKPFIMKIIIDYL